MLIHKEPINKQAIISLRRGALTIKCKRKKDKVNIVCESWMCRSNNTIGSIGTFDILHIKPNKWGKWKSINYYIDKRIRKTKYSLKDSDSFVLVTNAQNLLKSYFRITYTNGYLQVVELCSYYKRYFDTNNNISEKWFIAGTEVSKHLYDQFLLSL